MSLALLLGIGIFLTVVFHFIGVYAGAKKIVWVAIVLLWAAAVSFATHEVKPKAYEDIKKMQGHYKETDRLIEEAMPQVSLYELLNIKKSYLTQQKLHENH